MSVDFNLLHLLGQWALLDVLMTSSGEDLASSTKFFKFGICSN